MNLGEKIKKERLAKGLTQKELAGEVITRNMLSQIENGTATPSLQTLLYFANRLSLPAAYFLSQEDSPFLFQKQAVLPKLQLYMKHRRFGAVLESWQEEWGMDDELSMILGAAHLECGKDALFQGNLITAETHFQKALSLLSSVCYPVDALIAQGMLYLAVAKNVASPSLALNEETYLEKAEESTAREFFHYIKNDTSYPYKNPLYAQHMKAKEREKQRYYQEALALLSEIEERKGAKEVHAVLLFRVYADMELCYREMRDYENAYRYSSKRLAQLAAFKT